VNGAAGATQAATAPDPSDVARRILSRYRRDRRDLPWRRTRDPYAVWVSEVMLQQTRVATAMPYYERWLARFPTVEALAAAPLDEVLAAWSGLGYYRRARNLHRGAAEVVSRYGGRVPGQAEELRALPGIGRYTAGAIASIAFGQREPVVDGNVARVLARVYAIEGELARPATQARLWALAGQMVPRRSPGDFNQAAMELGALVCTPTSPRCPECPVGDVCLARAQGRQHALPTPAPRKAERDLPLIDLWAAWIERRGRVLMVRRRAAAAAGAGGGGLYAGLWELPAARRADELNAIVGRQVTLLGKRPVVVHRQVLSHRRLRIRLWPAHIAPGKIALGGADHDRFRWQAPATIRALAVSSATVAVVTAYERAAQAQR
jgi:A/G-specific adenine glycosylase